MQLLNRRRFFGQQKAFISVIPEIMWLTQEEGANDDFTVETNRNWTIE